jgi:hypothetical protein
MSRTCIRFCCASLFFVFGIILHAHAQRPRVLTGTPVNTQPVPQFDATGRPIGNRTTGGNDSLTRRDNNLDSITIYYRYFDSTRIRYLDSSINNFYNRFPVPPQYVHLGNLGTAARSLLFDPRMQPGWDAGFHAFDIYKLKIEDTRFYQTTRPYTELGYLLGSKSEQMVNILHTQNIKPNFNMAFQYRFINAPGNYKNQNTSHNSFRINGNYQSTNKRYTAYAIFISNNLKSSENGGVKNDSLLSDPVFSDRFLIPTRLGGDVQFGRNFFNTNISLGNLYKETQLFYRHQYDLGQRDSLVVNDSTTIKLFYPRLRFQHTFSYNSSSYSFQDYPNVNQPNPTRKADYLKYFGQTVTDSIKFVDAWRKYSNDFSIISFPEKNNLNQFLKAGITVENLHATFGLPDNGVQKNYHNLFVNGEYRNRTRNQKWDIEAKGNLYFNGLNNGDYLAQIKLKRLLSAKLGYAEIGFENVNRMPSFVFQDESHYPVSSPNLNKENITRISGSLTNDAKSFTLSANLYLVSNYTYFDSFFSAKQESKLFNVLHVAAEKKFVLFKKWLNVYTQVHLQQTAGNPPLNLPMFFTFNRLVHEGVFAKNMVYAYGVELRYHTPFKADDYSPFVGQFFYQENTTISNRPEVNLFGNFRIKSFNAFVRLENLQSLNVANGKVNFTAENKYVPHYYYPGLWLRVGIWWRFVN